MAQPYVGQIESFGFNFAPRGWIFCAGQLLPINQYQALFSLLGTTYGGNGVNNFAVPDLRGRLSIGQGSSAVLGAISGQESHTLITAEIPLHNHLLNAAVSATPGTNSDVPGPALALANGVGKPKTGANFQVNLYVADANPSQPLAAGAIGMSPGGVPHNNMMPYLTVNFCISLSGIFPSRN